MADSVKGAAMERFSPGIRQGIRLHREIDAYTDAHPVFRESITRLRTRFGKYAPVVADVFYDHFLAASWDEYHPVSLREYVNSSYSRLEPYYRDFPVRTQRFYDYMLKYDILYRYASLEGIDRVMQGMARRANFTSGMEQSLEELQQHYQEYRAEFAAFFPHLQQHIRTFSL